MKKPGGIFLTSVSAIDVAMSIRQLSVMLKSGLALESALRMLSEQTADPRLKYAYVLILAEVASGQSLAVAMSKHTKIFSEVTISIISVGEQGGTLERSLIYLSDFLKKEYELQRKVKGALLYPTIVFIMVLVEMLGMMFIILPKLDSLFSTFKNLPPFTMMILGISRFLRTNTTEVAVGFGAVALAVYSYSRTKTSKIVNDNVSLKIPIVKKLQKSNILMSFSRTLGILLESGIPLVKALEISTHSLSNTVYIKALAKVHDKVKSGQTLSVSLADFPNLFPADYTKMIEVAEQTGSLEDNLSNLYEFYSAEVQDMSNNLSTLLEPILLVFIGLMIALLAISIVMPIYQLTGSINDQ